MSRLLPKIRSILPALLLSLTAVASPASAAFDLTPAQQAWVRAHGAAYIWEETREGPQDPSYNLTELGRLSKRAGFRVVRAVLGGYGNDIVKDPRLPPPNRTFLDNLRSRPYRDLIANFDTIIFTIGIPPQIWEPAWTRERYREITEYLLRTYSGKTFILGHWEGDHWCPGNHTWPQAIALFNARHDGIVAGRAAVPRATSKVLEMIEMVKLDYSGRDFMVNNLVPQAHADLYSLSTWAYVNELPKALAYLKRKCPDSPRFGNDNVMIGEIGILIKRPPQQRVDFFRDRIREMMAAKAPYAVFWDLADGDCGLMDGKYHRGRKFLPYYLFYRALHAQDARPVVDDFEADPLGLPGGERDETGYPINNLGGHRSSLGEAFGALIWQHASPARPASRVLALRLPKGGVGAGWEEQLLDEFDASRCQALDFWARGDLSALSVGLTDARGKRASVPLSARARSDWRQVRIPRRAFPGLDWKRLRALSFASTRSGNARFVFLDDIAFEETVSPEPRHCARPLVGAHGVSLLSAAGAASPSASQLALRNALQPLPLPATGGPLKQVILSVAAGATLLAPTLTDGKHTMTLADRLGAWHSLTLKASGEGVLRLNPLGPFFEPANFERIGLTSHGLQRNEDFLTLHPLAADRQGYLEWRFSSPYLVKSFHFVLYGRDNRSAGGRLGISFSTDGSNWRECAITRGDATWPHLLEGLIGTPPAGYEPSRRIWVRFWVEAASADKNWYWNASIADIKLRLALDTTGLRFPDPSHLRYRDRNPANLGYRGLLDLDW
jgi:hypothetical protein